MKFRNMIRQAVVSCATYWVSCGTDLDLHMKQMTTGYSQLCNHQQRVTCLKLWLRVYVAELAVISASTNQSP